MQEKWDEINVSGYEVTYRELHQPGVSIGGCFALVAVGLSIFLIFQHLRSYTNPAEQNWMVAVIFIVPVCYGVGGERTLIELLENESRKQLGKPLLGRTDENERVKKSSFTNFFFRPCVVGRNLFVIESLMFSVSSDDSEDFLCILGIIVGSLWGLWGWGIEVVLGFYNVTLESLKPIKPLSKFISFKAIVFATWWQGAGIALLCAFGILPNEKKFRTGLQDFLICTEMAIAAVAHTFVFSAEPYHFVPSAGCGKIAAKTTTAELKVGEDDQEKPAVLDWTETQVADPGTSITKSVQDIVLQGGQSATGPVEKGVTKIQETFHQRLVGSKSGEDSVAETEESV